MKVGAIADLHFGKNVNASTLLDRDREAHIQLVKAMDFLVKKQQVDAVAVLGDISHTNYPSIAYNLYVKQALKTLDSYKLPVLVMPGNHDYTHRGYHVLQPFMNLWEHVEIVDEPQLWNGMCVVPHSPKSVFNDVKSKEEYIGCIEKAYLQALLQFPSKILLTHAQIQGCVVGSGYVFESGALEIQHDIGVDLIVAGDVHKGQIYLQGNTTIAYPGSLTQTDYGEKKDMKGVAVFDTETLQIDLHEIEGYIKYCDVDLKSLQDFKSVEDPIWYSCIVNVNIMECVDRESIIKKVFEKSPLSLRSINLINKDTSQAVGVQEIIGQSYEEQFQEYMTELFSDDEAQRDRITEVGLSIMRRM